MCKQLVVSWMAVLSALAFADEKAAGPPKPSPPPPEVKQTVDAVAGKWTGQMTAAVPGEEAERFAWMVECEPVALGAGVSCTQGGKASMGSLAESCLIAYDPASKSVHKMCVGSMGEVHDHKGYWKDKRTIEFEPLKGTMQGKPITETITMTFSDAKTLTNRSIVELPDGTKMRFEFIGNRKK